MLMSLNKRKFINKTLTVLLASSLFLANDLHTSGAVERSLPEENQMLFIDDLFEKDIFNEYLENQINYYFTDEFLGNLGQARIDDQNIMALFPINRLGQHIYPEFIGGIYYNPDGNLVLQLVEDNISYGNETVESLRNMDVIFEYVEFSHTYLNSLMDSINSFILTSTMPENFQKAGLRTSLNKVEVWLYNYNEYEKYNFLNNVINSYAIQFLKAEEDVVRFSLIEYDPNEMFLGWTEFMPFNNIVARPGMGINIPGLGSISVGYRARLNGANGIITTGHTGLGVGHSVPGVGIIGATQNSGNVDAAFIITNLNVEPSNEIHITRGNLSTTVVTQFREGDAFAKIGHATNIIMGTVTHENYSFLHLTGQVRTTATAAPGDSGGIVFSTPAIGPPHGGNTAGIVVGVIGGNMVFTRANAIQASLGATRY